MKDIMAWHFCRNWQLMDGRKLSIGKTYRHKGKLVLCSRGLHASQRAIDALFYGQGGVVSRVQCGGEILLDSDKLVCSRRKVVWAADVSDIIQKFQRLCALDVIHLWEPPDVVVQYLKTGDGSLMTTAFNLAWDHTRKHAPNGWSVEALASHCAVRAATKDCANDLSSGGLGPLNAALALRLSSAPLSAACSSFVAVRERQNRRLTAMLTSVSSRIRESCILDLIRNYKNEN